MLYNHECSEFGEGRYQSWLSVRIVFDEIYDFVDELFTDKVAVTAMALAGLTNFFMAAMAAIDPNCDYYQEMTLGQTYYLYNKEYPNNYPPNTSCRWVARSPANTRIILSCEDIQIPPVSNCFH